MTIQLFIGFSHIWISTKGKTNQVSFQGYLGGEVLLGGEGLSESTESMLDQVIQLTWMGGGGVEVLETSVFSLKFYMVPVSVLTVLEVVHQPLQVGAGRLGARSDGHGLTVKVVG